MRWRIDMRYALSHTASHALPNRGAGRAEMAREFQGCLYDIVEQIVIDRAAVLRGSFDEAMADAKAMGDNFNADLDAAEDDAGGNFTYGRVDESYCFVMVDGEISYADKAEKVAA